jgi:zinc protease
MRSSMRSAAAAVAFLVVSSVGPAAFGAASVQQSKLSNGSPFLAAVDTGPPRQIVTLVYETGCKVLPKEHVASASLLEYIALEGPLGKTNAEYRRELFLLNAGISMSIAGRGLFVVVTAPPSTLEAALQITSELVQKPKLIEDQLKVAQQRSISRRRAQQQDMRFLTDLAAQRHLYPGHPDAYSCISKVSDIEGSSLAALKSDWAALTEANRRTFGTVGPMPIAEVRTLIESTLLKDNKARYKAGAAVKLASFRKPASPGGTDVVLLEQADAQDNQVMYIWPHTLQPDTAGYATAEIAFTLLGGGFTGRLQQELREKRGLTYGAFANIYDELPQYIGASFAGGDKVGRLIQELPQVYDAFIAEQQTEERIGIAKEALVTGFRESTELPLDSFLMALNARIFGRDPNAWRGRDERWVAVTKSGLEQFIKGRMTRKPSYLVVAGDPKVLLPVLEKAGYPKESIKMLSADDL